MNLDFYIHSNGNIFSYLEPNFEVNGLLKAYWYLKYGDAEASTTLCALISFPLTTTVTSHKVPVFCNSNRVCSVHIGCRSSWKLNSADILHLQFL